MRKIRAMRHVLFLLGIVLSGAAFAAAAFDMAAHGIDASLGALAGADEVWRTVSPETYAAWTAAWPQLVIALLALPGWLIFGAPGLALVIFARAKDQGAGNDAHSLFLFDDLARQAREDGYVDDEPMDGLASIELADKSFAEDNIEAPAPDDAPGDGAETPGSASDTPQTPGAKPPSDPA